MLKKLLFWNYFDEKVRRNKITNIIIQTIVMGLAALLLIVAFSNYAQNVKARNIGIGFDFLDNSAGFYIGQSFIKYESSDSFLRVYAVGLINTLVASFIMIILATIIGVTVGIFLMANNWLLQKISLVYIEMIRNIPPLLHVLFWYVVVILRVLPDYKDSINIFNMIFINVQGTTIPAVAWDGKSVFFLVLFLFMLSVSIFLIIRKDRRRLEGIQVSYRNWHIGIIVAIVLLWLVFSPFSLDMPIKGKFRYTGGFTFNPEMFALIIALSTYTSTFIATIVKSSIVAIPKVQVEAAHSLGLNFFQRLRYIIIPLALRSMIPPLTNQYLNIIKNSSLGVAIGYPELIAVFAGTALNQTGRAIEIMSMVMFTYFAISVLTSWLMNIYNKKVIR